VGLFAVIWLLTLAFASSAAAAQAPSLGTSASFAVLGGSMVTNTGTTVVNGDLGVSPGGAVTGFPPGIVNGTIHPADAVAAQAQSAVTIAYNDLAGRPCNTNLTGQDLGGLTLTTGVYCFSTSAQLTGTLTLDAQGDANAAFIFQTGSTLTTASGSRVNLINGAQSCNVFWQVGSSGTLGTTTAFSGNMLALTAITANTGATVDGRLLARNAAVTLDTNSVTRAECAAPSPSPSPSPSGPGSGTDVKGPSINIGGAPGDGIPGNPVGPGKPCIARDFRLEITAHDKSGIKRVTVFLDGELIKRSTKGHFFVWIRAKNLASSRHTIRIVARDRAGNETVKKRTFGRCNVVSPSQPPSGPGGFTG
jgi:Ice-binding-like